MAIYYVTCHTPDDLDIDRRIQGLGGAGWWMPIDEIIERIDSGADQFWIQYALIPTKVVVKQRGPLERKYLCTLPDSTMEDNLLKLPDCKSRSDPSVT
jgi:hypothetical protein